MSSQSPFFKLLALVAFSLGRSKVIAESFDSPAVPSFLQLADCPPFNFIENGKTTIKHHSNGTLALIIICDENYTLIGGNEAQCVNGYWKFGAEETFPKCRRRCSPPPYLEHGALSFQKRDDDVFAPSGSYSEGTVVTYSCNVGYTLEPEARSVRICEKGHWTGPDVFCKELGQERMCPRPPLVENGVNDFIYFDQAPLGVRVSYVCSFGYKLVGPESIMCAVGGIWIPEAPLCVSESESGNPFADFSAPPASAVSNGVPDFFSQTASQPMAASQNMWNAGNAFQPPSQQPFGDLGMFNANNSSVFDPLGTADSRHQVSAVPAQPQNVGPQRPPQPVKILTGDLESSLNSLVENLTMDSGSGKWNSPKNQPKTATAPPIGWQQPQGTAAGAYRPMMGVQPQMMPQQPFVPFNMGYQQPQVAGNVTTAGTEPQQQQQGQQPPFDPFGAL